MSSNDIITANITENATIINNDIETKSKELLSSVVTKSLILVGMIALICILIFIIGIILYCIIKKFRSNSSSSLEGISINTKPKNFEFRKLQNESSLGNEQNKVNVSLSEIRVKNLQLESNQNNVLEIESNNKKKDDDIDLNTGNHQVLSGSSSPGRDNKIKTKELVNNLANSIDRYMFNEGN